MKLLDEKAPAFGIKNLKMVSFSAQRGYGYKYTATDVAVAVNAILELSGKKDPELNFHTGKSKSLISDQLKNEIFSNGSVEGGQNEGSSCWNRIRKETAQSSDEYNQLKY